MRAAGLWGIASALASAAVKKSRVGADAAIGVITIASFALGVGLFAKFGTSGPSFDDALFGSILGISWGRSWAWWSRCSRRRSCSFATDRCSSTSSTPMSRRCPASTSRASRPAS